MSFLENGGFGGLSMLYPVLIIGSAFFALCGSAFFAAWVYQDGKSGAMIRCCGRLWFLRFRPLSDCFSTFYAARR